MSNKLTVIETTTSTASVPPVVDIQESVTLEEFDAAIFVLRHTTSYHFAQNALETINSFHDYKFNVLPSDEDEDTEAASIEAASDEGLPLDALEAEFEAEFAELEASEDTPTVSRTLMADLKDMTHDYVYQFFGANRKCQHTWVSKAGDNHCPTCNKLIKNYTCKKYEREN